MPVPGASYQRLGHWDMASRLSYLLWGTCPTPTLFAAAEAGKLGTRRGGGRPGQAHAGRSARRPPWSPTSPASGCTCASWPTRTRTPPSTRPGRTSPAPVPAGDRERSWPLVWKGDAKLDTLLSAPYTVRQRPAGGLLRRQGRDRRRLPEGGPGSRPAGGRADPGQHAGGQVRPRSELAHPARRVRARADVLPAAAAAARHRSTPTRPS